MIEVAGQRNDGSEPMRRAGHSNADCGGLILRSVKPRRLDASRPALKFSTTLKPARVLLLCVGLIVSSPQFAMGGTALGDLASTMTAGSWAQLQTSNIGVFVDCPGGGQGQHLPYAEGMKWDPISRRIYYIGSDDPIDCGTGLFVAYDEATNTWIKLSAPFLPGVGSHIHQYDGLSIDVTNRKLYYAQAADTQTWQYDLTNGIWSIRNPGLGGYSCCEALAYFPEMQALIHFRNGTVYRLNDGASSWTTITTVSPPTSYHSVAEYNPVHKVMVFGGGSGASSASFYKMTSTGVVTQLAPPPNNLNAPITELTYDPVSGAFLYLDYRQNFYSFNVLTNTWTALPKAGVPSNVLPAPDGIDDHFNSLATPIPDYGVIMFTTCRTSGPCSVYLYKHSAGTTTAPAKIQNLLLN